MSTNKKNKQEYPQTEFELTAEIQALLADFTAEEIESGIIQTGRPPANGSHTIHDLVSAYQDAILKNTIGDMLRAAREGHDHSLQDAGDALGVSRARAHQLERPDANLRIDTLQRYAHAYGYKVQVALVPKNKSEPSIIAELPE